MNLEEIWKWLKGKRNTFFCGGGNCLCFNCCSGCCRNYGGEDPVLQSLQKWSLYGLKAEANKWRSKSRRTLEKKQETSDGGSDCRRAVPNHGTKQCDYRADGFLFQSSGKAYPAESLAKGGADSIETFCRIYVEEAQAEGVRPEVAFVQTMKETGFLQYGGDASIEQFNFAGLGTTGGGVPGNSYPDVRTGCGRRSSI